MLVLCAPEAFSTAWHVCCRSHIPVELINWRPRFHGMALVLTGRSANTEFHRSLRYRPGCFLFFWPRCCHWFQKWWVCEVLVTFSYPMLRARQGRKGWKRQCIHPKQIFATNGMHIKPLCWYFLAGSGLHEAWPVWSKLISCVPQNFEHFSRDIDQCDKFRHLP